MAKPPSIVKPREYSTQPTTVDALNKIEQWSNTVTPEVCRGHLDPTLYGRSLPWYRRLASKGSCKIARNRPSKRPVPSPQTANTIEMSHNGTAVSHASHPNEGMSFMTCSSQETRANQSSFVRRDMMGPQDIVVKSGFGKLIRRKLAGGLSSMWQLILFTGIPQEGSTEVMVQDSSLFILSLKPDKKSNSTSTLSVED